MGGQRRKAGLTGVRGGARAGVPGCGARLCSAAWRRETRGAAPFSAGERRRLPVDALIKLDVGLGPDSGSWPSARLVRAMSPVKDLRVSTGRPCRNTRARLSGKNISGPAQAQHDAVAERQLDVPAARTAANTSQ
jgi:hypothetical protein